jgi:hypothetical protein
MNTPSQSRCESIEVKLGYKGCGGWTFSTDKWVMECRSIGMDKAEAQRVLKALNATQEPKPIKFCPACEKDWKDTPASEKPAQEEGPYIIYYEDQDVRPEIFMGAGARIAAEQRYTTAKHQWACHLFAKVVPDPDIGEWPNPPLEKRNADER